MTTTNTDSRLWVLCALAALGGSGAALAGDVTGKVPLEDPLDAQKAVVYLKSVPGAFTPPTAQARLSQKGARFSPAVLPVLKGTVVDLTNDDRVTHSVFSKSDTLPFDLGLYSKAERKTLRFEAVGAVDVFCSIHPKMKATVLVLSNPYFAHPEGDGSFVLRDVPAGTYQLAIYKAGEPLKTLSVKVPPSGSVKVATEKAAVSKKT